MKIFDAHNDLITKIYKTNEKFYQNSCHIDMKRMLDNTDCTYTLCCALFVPELSNLKSYLQANSVIDYFSFEIDKNNEYANLLDYEKKISIILSLEGGECLCGDKKNVEHFYKRGVRAISLTWNNSNELSGGCNDSDIGISILGKEILEKMSDLNMILDLSHISDRGFYDACELFTGKIIASHSNVRKICKHKRNLSDDMIRKIANVGGMIGINLNPPFLCENGKASIKDVLNHIEYIASIANVNTVGFGFDFDGIDDLPTGINGIQDVDRIINEMGKLNYKDSDIIKISGLNFMELFA